MAAKKVPGKGSATKGKTTAAAMSSGARRGGGAARTRYTMAYHAVSGFGEHASFLAMRWDVDAGFKSSYGETFVGCVEPDTESGLRIWTYFMQRGWLTGIWRSASGRVWVSESMGHMLTSPTPVFEAPRTEKLVGSLFGVWGLADDHVYTWGSGGLYRWNGKKWTEHPEPPFSILSMHGIDPGEIWAAGAGAVSRLRGKKWESVAIPSDEQIVCVFQAGPREVYACGNGGTIFEGDAKGLDRAGRILGAVPGDVTAVAPFAGRLWVAANRLGTWARKGKSFTCVKPNVESTALDVRGDMVLACKRNVVNTADGQAWWAAGDDFILDMRGKTPLGGPYP